MTQLGTATNLLWVVIGAMLVIFMQAGFALVETGFCRAKHAAHVVSTNFAIFGIAFIGFFFVGFPLAFGGFSYAAFGMDVPMSAGGLLGSGNWVFLWKGGWAMSGGGITPAVLAFFLYMVAFMDTVATIPTGAMAERWKWNSFVVWGLFCGAIYYPLFAAWTWGGGWLAKSWDTWASEPATSTSPAPAWSTRWAASLRSPARRCSAPASASSARTASHAPSPATTSRWRCSARSSSCSGGSASTPPRPSLPPTCSSPSSPPTRRSRQRSARTGAMVYVSYIRKSRFGKPDPGMMANGMLAGLVAITAPCAFVAPWAAAVIGVIASVLVVESILFVEHRLKIDDPVGAISVHGVNGLFGVLAVGIFANGSYGAGWNGSDVEGVEGLIKGEVGQFGAQLLGAVVICTVIFGIAYGFFTLQNKLTKGGIRPSEEDEIQGLDIPEMGVPAYPEFDKIG